MASLLIRAILVRLGRDATERVRKACPSRALRDGMFFEERPPSIVAIVSPHYWAYYVHQGRNAVSKKLMVFFPNKHDDPRTLGGRLYPERQTDRKPLTLSPEDFKRLRRSGELVVTMQVGPTNGVPFFDRGMAGFGVAGGPAGRIVRETVSEYLKTTELTVLEKGPTARAGL